MKYSPRTSIYTTVYSRSASFTSLTCLVALGTRIGRALDKGKRGSESCGWSLLMYKDYLLYDPILGRDDLHDYVTEFRMWRSCWSSVLKSSLPNTVFDTYEQCLQNYPVTKKLLLIYATLPGHSICYS